MDIKLIGSLEGGNYFSSSDIVSTLRHPMNLEHNGPFTGRPATELFVSDIYALKIRNDFLFLDQDAERRAMAALTRERELAVHHPCKSWFVLEDGAARRIGNITPRLSPLRTGSNRNNTVQNLVDVLAIYLNTAATYNIRLDEGISNFGRTNEGALHYLDDDLYSWDDFTSMSQSLGNWIRRLPDVTPEDWIAIGGAIFRHVLAAFGSLHAVDIFLGQIRNCICINVLEQQKLHGLTEAVHALRRGGRGRQPIARGDAALEWRAPARFGVIADIHGNGPALDACLDALHRREIDHFLILGDIVGYGPHPRYCIDRVRQLQAIIVQGNHDYAVCSGDTSSGFSQMALWAVVWTRDILDDEQRRWLAGLEPVWRQGDWIAVHGAPVDKNYFLGYVYAMTFQENLDWLQDEKIPLAFHGHSHIPKVYARAGRMDMEATDDIVSLDRVDYALLCPGSVGQPRQGQTAAECAIYDGASRTFEFLRTEYPLEETAADMRRANFPAKLIARLMSGT